MELLSRNFLNSIVWVGDFELDYKEVNLNVLCIEDGDTEVRTRHSDEMCDYWMLQLYSGIHRVLIGFKELSLSIVKTSS